MRVISRYATVYEIAEAARRRRIRQFQLELLLTAIAIALILTVFRAGAL